MTNSPPSSSDGQDSSTAFGRLHPVIQRWIWQRKWNELRDIQESAAHAILGTSSDVLVAAATASGKTEAAFFPLLTTIAEQPNEPGIRVVYVSPLRTLINDQHMRLEDICRELDLPVHRWHGDVGASAKQAVLKKPRGIVLITPESLEALFVLRGPALKGLFSRVAAVVVDEVHSFIGEERGRQLQSLLHRLELIGRERIRRIGLSATLGDMGLAAEFLRPGAGGEVTQIISAAQGPGLKLQIRGYEGRVTAESEEGEEAPETANESIVEHLFQTLYGTENLVFCNRRQDVETYADKLRETAEGQKRSNLFFPHHGSLSRELREDVERLLKDDERPITVVCTSTLELGVDIGSVRSVAQVGPPPSVASLRQRLGRSGRRDEPAVLRLYVSERHIGPDTPPQDQLRAGLVQSIAMVELLLERWCEPPETGALHLSTLIQQVLSVVAQHGGAAAQQLFRLCAAGAFREVPASMFQDLLRALGQQDVLMQSEDGTLFLAPAGERIVEHYTFYSAFTSPEEYRVVSGGKDLGTLPLSWALGPGMYLIFAGRRWRVEVVDERARVIEVLPAEGGKPPSFGGSGGTVHARVRERMRELYGRSDEPIFLDSGAKHLLKEARGAFARFGLASRFMIGVGPDVVVFPWAGDRAQQTLLLMLASRGLSVQPDGIAITVTGRGIDEMADHIRDLAELPPLDPMELARRAPTRIIEKHDRLLTDDLLAANYASRHLDVLAAHAVAKRLAEAEA